METELTRLLDRAAGGDHGAEAELFQRVYDRLRAIAGRQQRDVAGRDSVPPTALVHEAYLKLFGSERAAWQGRNHFFAAAARAMRQIAVDYARGRGARKRGGGWARGTVSHVVAALGADRVDLLALDEALCELAALSDRQAHLVELRFFAGLSVEEAAQALDISPRTAQLEWRTARAWLHMRLSTDGR